MGPLANRPLWTRPLWPWMFVVLLCTVALDLINVMVVATDRARQDTFHEELFIRPLTGAFVISEFNFITTTTIDSTDHGDQKWTHFRLFPRALGEILAEYGVDELHLTFTQGSWRYSVWGLPPPPSRPMRSPSDSPAPSGVELWAWFGRRNESDYSSDTDASWTGLCNALSGLFCASLNFVGKTNTVTPTISFRRRGVFDMNNDKSSDGGVRYATLPQETVCTENLTPWKKMLPCGATAGLAMLLNARQLFNVHFLSMGIHVRPICRDRKSSCTASAVELSQTLTTVSEMSTDYGGKQDWSFKRLYDTMLFGTCPVATSSFVYVDVSKNDTDSVFQLTPAPSQVIAYSPGYRLAVYNVTQLAESLAPPFNLAASYSRMLPVVGRRPAKGLLTANRYIRGYGQEKGVIECIVRNDHPTKPLRVVYMEQIPSFAVVYAHTFRVKSNGQALEPEYLYVAERVDNSRPFHLEVVLTLPPDSVTEISFEFDKAFLKWTDYPPDANHGFYLGPAVISTNMHTESNSTYFLRIRTQVLLLQLPTPDFSMPYNVICLVCTVLALAFGPLHNITTKRGAANRRLRS